MSRHRDEDVHARVRRMWLEENRTAQEIGDAVGKSRNAIAGMVHRMGISKGRPSAPRKIAAPRLPKVAAPVVVKAHPLAVTAQPRHNVNPLGCTARLGVAPSNVVPIKADAVTPTARPWTSRGAGECAWPILVAGETLSCCAPAEGTYCAQHRRLAYSPVQISKRSLMKLANVR